MRTRALCVMTVVVVALCTIALGYPKVCIDPGHGGSDPGANSYTVEKVHNLDCGLKFRDWMNLDTSDSAGGYAWSVIMTRSTDVYVSLSGRTSYANNNGADRFVSIHANASSYSSANGSETFCYTYGSSNSFNMRNKLQYELISHGGLYNRGNKTANFYVIKYTNMPAALTENGFCTNYTDSLSLNSSSWRNEVAKGFLHAMQTHYGYSAYTPSSHVTKIVDNSNSGFSCSSNWGTGSWNSPYGSNYRWRGTEATSDAATWSVSLPNTASWTVYAWWTQGSNRSTGAPYIVYYSGGSSTVYKNQQSNGGQWNTLGTWSMNSGTNQVKLSCWAATGYVVIADAIKWYK